MLIKRKDAVKFITIAHGSLKEKKFNIQTTYKLTKLIKAIEEEDEMMNQTILQAVVEYTEKDEMNNPIIKEDGGYKIQPSKINEMQLKLDEIQKAALQIPDIYFSLDEFEDLTLEEMEALMPFIK